ncbi:MAG: DNA polymerase I [Prevotella sp.]|nr:DNA polymerase I [Prevotella sp.]MCM1075500.1 DNA polymerase I [Ruminococcus sp.]
MDTQNSSRLFLLDAYALIFRAYYALIKMPRTTSKGFNTSAIFGFVSTLEELLRKEKPTHIAVCFDPQGPTFRHEAYEAYKGEREATPEDIKLSIPYIKEIIRAYNIPVLEVAGFEADDVIGSMSVKASSEGITTYMVTPDKDFGQLVKENVFQYKPAYRGGDFELRGPEQVCERYGIKEPMQVIDILALMGDKVDNIPGCPGVGEKTATKLVGEFGSVENLIAHSADLKGALRKKVEENIEQIVFSKYLATIRTDVPLTETAESLKRKAENKEAIVKIFRKLEFRALEKRVLDRINSESGETASTSHATGPVQGSLFDFEDEKPVNQPVVTEVKNIKPGVNPQLGELEKAVIERGEYALFTVAKGASDMAAEPVGWAIAIPGGDIFYLTRTFAGAAELMATLLENNKVLTISHDIKRDYVILSNLLPDKDLQPSNFYDIALAHYVLEPEMRHDINILSESILHKRLPELEALSGKGAKRLKVISLPESSVAEWSGAMVQAVAELYPSLKAEIEKEGLSSLLFDMEFPLATVLGSMERAGVRVDVPTLNKAAEGMQENLTALETEIHTLAGAEFNIGSPAKVGEILFDRLGLDPKAKKTKSGQYSTSEEVLEKLAPAHPIVSKILEYRQIKKLLSTYLTALPQCINPATGKIHTTYNQTVTATGRISSSDPNLQNIPVRDEMGREIRRAFVPDPGQIFLSADYSQIELRLVADLANDDVMLDAFEHDKDIHAITASKIYHEDLKAVTSEQRRKAKTANFGILYGISAFGLANRLNIPRSEAKELIDGYFRTFPTIRQYMDQSIESAKEKGFVTTLYGRRRKLADINSRNPVVRGYAERNAINAPVQGSAADIIKIAMVRIHEEMRERGLKSVMTMQVHDELNFTVVPEELPVMQELVARQMQAAYTGRVRLSASVGVGENWLEAH